MPREGQIARILRVVQLIASRKHGVTVGEIVDEEDCSPRTIYRDLGAIGEAGFPIYSEKDDNETLWKFIDNYRLYIPIPFELNEIAALYYSRGMFKVFEGTAFYDSLESLVKRIRSSLTPETLGLVEQFENVFACGERPMKTYGQIREIVTQVNKACSERRRIDMVYHTLSRDAETQRRVDPYKIWYFEGALYLIGHCHWRNQVRMFSLDRIRLITLVDESFEIPPGFSVEEYMADCFGLIHDELVPVKVTFTGDAALWVRDKQWHPSQEITENPDGSITAAYQVGGTSEIKRWIMGFGAMAEVLEPEALRGEIIADLSKMVDCYSDKGGRPAKSRRR